jgi:crossover junction endodeoxyribonuclease RuvC
MIAAFDLSLTATGYACSDGRSGVLSPPKDCCSGIPRLQWIRNSVYTIARDAALVAIEGYAFDRPNQAHQIGELGGVIRVALHECGLPYVEIAPSSLKKFATGKGNAKKDDVFAAAIRKLGYTANDHNEADALWLLAMARAHYHGEPETLTQAQSEALAKIAWP